MKLTRNQIAGGAATVLFIAGTVVALTNDKDNWPMTLVSLAAFLGGAVLIVLGTSF